MSEYQYYEFRTIHQQLIAAQRAVVSKLSSHGQTTSTSFSVDYSYGNFKHDPKVVLASYFDAFFYTANWGSTRLMFRFPKELIDVRAIEPYCIEGSVTIDYEKVDESLILNFELNNEDGTDWVEGGGQIDGVLGLYDAILNGDHRALYLAWLGTAQNGSDDGEELDSETLEPPVPANLNLLSPELEACANLFAIDKDLIAAAAMASPSGAAATQAAESADVDSLTNAEKVHFLQRLLQGEENLVAKLRQHLKQTQKQETVYQPTGKRTIGELLAAKERITQQRKQAAEAAKAIQHRAQMAALAAQGDRAWQQVESLIAERSSESYKKAAILLRQLGELAADQGQTRAFDSRLLQIHARYSRLSSFIRALREQHLN